MNDVADSLKDAAVGEIWLNRVDKRYRVDEIGDNLRMYSLERNAQPKIKLVPINDPGWRREPE